MSYVDEAEVVRRIHLATEELRRDLREAHEEITALTEQANMLKYSFKGLCGEQLHLAVNIQGVALLQQEDAYTYLKFAIENGAKRLAYEAVNRFEDTYKLKVDLAQCLAQLAQCRPRA